MSADIPCGRAFLKLDVAVAAFLNTKSENAAVNDLARKAASQSSQMPLPPKIAEECLDERA